MVLQQVVHNYSYFKQIFYHLTVVNDLKLSLLFMALWSYIARGLTIFGKCAEIQRNLIDLN